MLHGLRLRILERTRHKLCQRTQVSEYQVPDEILRAYRTKVFLLIYPSYFPDMMENLRSVVHELPRLCNIKIHQSLVDNVLFELRLVLIRAQLNFLLSLVLRDQQFLN